MTPSAATTLFWLPPPPADWREALDRDLADGSGGRTLRRTCSARLEPSQLRRVATRLRAAEASGARFDALQSVRLALIGTGTLDFLADAIPGTAPRFGLNATVAPVEYDALSSDAALGRLDPNLDAVVILPDARSFVRPAGLLDRESHESAVSAAAARLEGAIAAVRRRSDCTIVLATIPPLPDRQFGSSDRALLGSERRFLSDLNGRIVELAEADGVVLWDLDALAAGVGALSWRDPVALHLAKSPFAIGFAPLVADRLCGLIAALVGKSRRALVLDLDNTCWGGVIGDDGVEGLVLGQGDPAGEAFVALQQHALELRRRGVVLCVCSKNEDAIAREPFRTHPDMILREEHIAVFQANWNDKATNLKAIADRLSLGTEALVFVDDNPAERARVRQLLPEVAVPELPDDPAWFATWLSAAGYFESASLNQEDLMRAARYGDNARRAEVRETLGDYDAYLASLDMRMTVRRFDRIGRARIAQLIGKSNQFNLTTRRRSEAEVAEIEESDDYIGLQFRLSDAFGDNGMISVVVLRLDGQAAHIDTWVMSCRVLERRVEEAVLNAIIRLAAAHGATRVIGEYIPTPRNSLVREHYPRLGFGPCGEPAADGSRRWAIEVGAYVPREVPIAVEGEPDFLPA